MVMSDDETLDLPSPTFVYAKGNELMMEWCFGEQGAADSWRIVFSMGSQEGTYTIVAHHPEAPNAAEMSVCVVGLGALAKLLETLRKAAETETPERLR